MKNNRLRIFLFVSCSIFQATTTLPQDEAPITYEECSICLEDPGGIPEEERTDLKCGHSFHKKCLEPWQRFHNTCPNCRMKITAGASDFIQAAAQGDIDTMKDLLSDEPSLINAGESDESPLTVAAKNNRYDSIAWLLQQPGINFTTKTDALLVAIGEGYTDIAELLRTNITHFLQHDKSQADDDDLHTLFRGAVYYEDDETVRELLPFVDINAASGEGKTALMYAIQESNTDIINLLLQQPTIDVNATTNDGKSTLMFALEQDNYEIAYDLLQNSNIIIDVSRFTHNHKEDLSLRLIMAAHRGDEELVWKLLPFVDINQQDVAGSTALIHAIYRNHPHVVKQLLTRPDVNLKLKNNRRWSALDYAQQNPEMNDLLSEYRRRINPRRTRALQPLY